MALAKERTQQSTTSQQPFVQGVDADSLHFMGSENHFPTFFDATNSSNRAYMTYEYGQQSSDAVQWAYNSSSSSLLKFSQGDHYSKANSKDDDDDEQEVECGLWLDGFQDGGDHEVKDSQKRPYMGGDLVAAKKQCGNNRKTKAKPSAASKDPQSIAAKNRRERISERLKILQDLVPNGTKVDLVTMLEKAISYVKFLQLQVKVLAADEFWPAQGGKAPELSQVKDAIDAILSSSRERKSSSTSQD